MVFLFLRQQCSWRTIFSNLTVVCKRKELFNVPIFFIAVIEHGISSSRKFTFKQRPLHEYVSVTSYYTQCTSFVSNCIALTFYYVVFFSHRHMDSGRCRTMYEMSVDSVTISSILQDCEWDEV